LSYVGAANLRAEANVVGFDHKIPAESLIRCNRNHFAVFRALFDRDGFARKLIIFTRHLVHQAAAFTLTFPAQIHRQVLLINVPQQLRSRLVRLQKNNFRLGPCVDPR
jgi:hypothetical protein